ncbi:hypothetical protein K7472_13220 [Streptomyces sp. PTM05]|uniref:Uncharacterized protein n=1 Tax=Streptantibioticus parmotrematis TaxID=2873249 RepID=A0ABS7QRJ8_9ACTN|nr:hypothetical protein [Streptantibioticus parmotrematis]MBY8885807.1 hypothetical protein [Streptantibioticus parmotrematis]
MRTTRGTARGERVLLGQRVGDGRTGRRAERDEIRDRRPELLGGTVGGAAGVRRR